MGAKAGFTLKLIQWFNRGVQFACCGLILALTAYFLAAMSNNSITIVSLTTNMFENKRISIYAQPFVSSFLGFQAIPATTDMILTIFQTAHKPSCGSRHQRHRRHLHSPWCATCLLSCRFYTHLVPCNRPGYCFRRRIYLCCYRLQRGRKLLHR